MAEGAPLTGFGSESVLTLSDLRRPAPVLQGWESHWNWDICDVYCHEVTLYHLTPTSSAQTGKKKQLVSFENQRFIWYKSFVELYFKTRLCHNSDRQKQDVGLLRSGKYSFEWNYYANERVFMMTALIMFDLFTAVSF